jgi:CRISPR-associated endonuclease/helicase Cas3
MSRPVTPWPEWIEDPGGLLAKSADRSEGDEPESLALHTWLVLSRLANQHRLRPDLAKQVDHPRLWHQAFWACFLHDFGKAAAGFQAVLRGESDRWQQRHEVLSLAFVGWLFPSGHPDRLPVIAAIASHHKNASDIYVRYLDHTEAAQDALNTTNVPAPGSKHWVSRTWSSPRS